MSTPTTPTTPSITGIDPLALADEIYARVQLTRFTAAQSADAALAYIAARQEPPACATCGAKYDKCPECAADDAYEKGRKDAACDREHDDEWLEVDEDDWVDLPDGTRLRREWERGAYAEFHHFVYRDDLPDPDADLVERMAQASFCVGDLTRGDWQAAGEDVKEKWRRWSRAALAVVREGER